MKCVNSENTEIDRDHPLGEPSCLKKGVSLDTARTREHPLRFVSSNDAFSKKILLPELRERPLPSSVHSLPREPLPWTLRPMASILAAFADHPAVPHTNVPRTPLTS